MTATATQAAAGLLQVQENLETWCQARRLPVAPLAIAVCQQAERAAFARLTLFAAANDPAINPEPELA